MPIKTIEIICLPCPKCSPLREKITTLIKTMEMQNKVKIVYEFKTTPNLREIGKYSLSPSQAPVLLINGNVEFAGKIDMNALRLRLEAINKF